MSVTQDTTSRKYLPATSAEWTELLTGLGINNPSSWWTASNASGATLTDSGSGGRNVTIAGSPALGAAAPGFTATGIKPTDGSATMYGSFTGSDVNTTSSMLLQVFALNTAATAARGLNRLGTATAEHATLQSGNKLRATSNANTSDGTQQQAGILVVVTKFDRASSVLGVYTKWEQLKPTYAAPGASTTFYLFGNGSAASDATFVYGAYWNSTDAEIADSKIQDLIDAVYGAETTADKMQVGSFAHKWVVAVEGVPYLLTDAPKAAVVSAYAGRDWTSTANVLQGLFVELHNDQSVEALNPFTNTGRCTLRIQDDGTDTLGKFIARRQGGDETTLTATVDRNDTTLSVRSTAEFASSGTVYIGTEAISYTGVTATSFTGCTRGLCSPFGTALSGSGGIRFGNPHRVGSDINNVQLNPIVSSIPRVWIGKRVGVWLHTWDAENQTINSRTEAQLVFAGRISGISESHEQVGVTTIELEHEMKSFREATIGKDLWSADIPPGVSLMTGRSFNFSELIYLPAGTISNAANALTVVASGASGTNQINAGRYGLVEIAEALSRWLGGEIAAGRIDGYHSISSPVTSNEGLRTRIYSNVANATSNVHVECKLTAPSEVLALLGIWDFEASSNSVYSDWNFLCSTNVSTTNQGANTPFSSLVFRVLSPSLFGGGFNTDALYYDADNERGTFQDQYDTMPACVKAYADPAAEWGLFLLDEKVLIIGYYNSSTRQLQNCCIAPYQLAANNDASSLSFIGRRADEDSQGVITVRQVLVMEGSTKDFFLRMAYSSGADGYNHATYDTFNAGIGCNIPGELLGAEFEASVSALPNADAPIVVVIDEPVKLADLFGGDLNFRWAFVRWKDEHFELKQWKTPMNAQAVATLTESNKAGQPGDNHRVVSRETAENQHAIVKIDSSRDFGFGRTGEYFRTHIIEDQSAVDDKGGDVSPTVIRLRNTFGEFASTGSSVTAGLGEFIAHLPSVSRVTREIERSVDHRYFEQLAPGDIVTVEDNFARDPLTGERGVNSRAAFVTRVAYTPGAPSPDPGSKPSNIDGRITINFLDTQRGQTYAPAADVDNTAAGAGYNAGTKTLTCYAHHYSHEVTIPYAYGTIYLSEEADATYFPAGSKVNVIERDPSNPASPLTWSDTVVSQTGNTIVLTTGLAGYDTAKRYIVVPQKYSQVISAQHEVAYMADTTDEMVEDDEIAWHFSVTDGTTGTIGGYVANTTADPGEFVADMCYGDGRPWDVGYDRAIARTINAGIDYQSAHVKPFLSTQAQGNYNEAGTQWVTMFFVPMFLGTESLTTAINRALRVAPWFRSRTGGTAKVRVTITPTPPTGNIGGGFLPGENFSNSTIIDRYSRSAEWTTTSTTWGEGSVSNLDLSVKEIFMGFVYVLVEGYGFIECRGLSRCDEGPRVVT